MKRIKRSVTQRAWKYDEMFPTFVSIVPTGANRIPFAALKLSEDGEYGEGYEIKQIIFGAQFTEESATAYLEDKGITDYSLQKLSDGRLYVENSHEFTDVKSISLDNIEVFVGKTDYAAKQVKTQIVSGNPVMKLEDNVDTLEGEATVALEDATSTEVVTEEVTATEVADAEPVDVKLEDNQETVEEPVEETTETVEGETTTEVEESTEVTELALSDNCYIDSLKDNNAYYVVDTFIYKLRYNLQDILESKVDIDTRVKDEVVKFADAIVAHFNAIESIPEIETEDLQMSDQSSIATAIEATPESLLIETITKKLAEFQEKLDSALEKSTPEVDNTTIMLQTSKADVTAFDQSQTTEVKPQVKQVTSNTKNLFGLN